MGYSRGTGIGQACHTVPQASEARSLPAWQSSHPIDLDERGFIFLWLTLPQNGSLGARSTVSGLI